LIALVEKGQNRILCDAGGTLTLEWQPNPDEAGNGRFVQVSEVWLIK